MVLSEVCQVMVGMLLYPVVDYVFNFFQCYRHVEVDGEALSSLLWSPDVLCGSEEWLHAMPFAAVGVCYLAAWIVLQVRMAIWMRAHHLFDQWKDPKFEEEMRRSTGSNGQEGATTGRNESGNAVEDSVEKTLSFASIRDSVAKVPSIGSVRDSIRSSESVGSARTAFESLIAGVALPPRQQQLYRFRFGLHWWDLATTVRAVLFHSVMTCDFFPDDMKTFLVLLLTIGGAVNVACLQPNVYWCVNILEISTEFATLAMIFLYRKIQRSVLESDEDHEEQSLKHDGYASTALYMLVAFFACYVLSRALWMVYHQEASDRADKRDADTFADRLCRLAMRVAHANPQALQREMEKLDEYSLREVVRSLDSIEQVLSPESLQETMRRSRLSAFDWRTKPMNEELETAFDVVRGSSHRASRSTASSGASSGVLGLPSFRSSVRSAASALMQPDGASLGAAGGATPAGTSQGGAGDAAPAETMRGAAEDAGASPVSAEEEEGATEAAGIPGDEDCTPPPGEGLSLQGAARGREVPRDAADAGASGEAEENSEIIDRI